MLSSTLNRFRRIGIEIEMAIPLIGGGSPQDLRVKMAKILSANGLRAVARGYSHAPVGDDFDVVVEHDNSIVGESVYSGIEWVQVEVKTRILSGTADFDAVVKKLCEISRYLGARQNRSTGVHLHLDFPELRDGPERLRSFYNLAHRFEPVFFGLVAPSRRENSYCKPMPSPPKFFHACRTINECQNALNLAGYDRYWGFNLTHTFGSTPRIEFRQHQGSLDFEKLRHWRNLCLRLVDHSLQRNCKASPKPLANDKASLMRMLVTLGLKPNTRVFKTVDPELRETGRFLLRRWKQLNAQQRTAEVEPPLEGTLPQTSPLHGIPRLTQIQPTSENPVH
jgi:hypothetical protein